ncbi:MAG: hypothetical protein ABI548_15510 [Polyangiaceae bacterium]
MPHSRILLGLAGLGVCVCAACGSKFTSADPSGGNAGAAASADGGSGAAGAPDSGGDAGETSTAGSGGTISAGSGGTISAGAGGSSAGHGGSSAGAGGSSAGSGGTSGKGGRGGSTGTAGTSGTAGASVCDTLEADYPPLLEKARVCDKGSLDQCSPSSKLSPLGGCGCAVLVNAKSAATTLAQKKYQELQDNKCLNNGGVICNVACLPPTGASCEQQMTGTSSTAFVCTGSALIAK